MIGGLDLAARERNPSGACIYPLNCRTLKGDDEIVVFLGNASVVAVDAPLSLEEPWRDAEKELISLGFRPLPLSMESMRELHARATRLASLLRGEVIETFVQPLRTRIVEYLARKMRWNKHERDAFLCALVAKAYEEGSAFFVGERHRIYLVKRNYVEERVRELLRTG